MLADEVLTLERPEFYNHDREAYEVNKPENFIFQV